MPGDGDPDRAARKTDKKAKDVQPGTGEKGKSWQSRSPDPDDKDDKLKQALKDSFPASDPPQPAQPGVTGWDVDGRRQATRPARSAEPTRPDRRAVSARRAGSCA